MRLILSRKGFDSSAGGAASPILPDGRLVSLPIPDPAASVRYAHVTAEGVDLGGLARSLSRGRVRSTARAHLDPDLVRGHRARARGWRPCFGQAAAAQSALAREGVGPGDLFLFFGWFRAVERAGRGWRFVRGAPDLHVVFGWLEVEGVLDLGRVEPPGWASEHPHVVHRERPGNTLYVATKENSHGRAPGGGVFPRLDDALVLTAPDAPSRSHWELPGWFAPRKGRAPLGYHGRADRWSRRGGRARLRSVARGQEFVLDVEQYPEARAWLRELPWPA